MGRRSRSTPDFGKPPFTADEEPASKHPEDLSEPHSASCPSLGWPSDKAKLRQWKEFRLLHMHQVRSSAPWLLDSPTFITSGYRVHFSKRLCVMSIFRLHNETWNTWTHLLAFFFFLYSCVFLLIDDDYHFGNKIVLTIYFTACMICFLASTAYHMFNSHSERSCFGLLKFDLGGICVLTTAFYIPPIYASLECFPLLRTFYLTCIGFLGLGCTCCMLFDRLGKNEFRFIRICLFSGLAIFGLVPSIQISVLIGLDRSLEILQRIAVMYSFLFLGVIVYVFRIPERFAPGLFDIWFHSHQIWHVATFLAAFIHLNTCLRIIHISVATPCEALGF